MMQPEGSFVFLEKTAKDSKEVHLPPSMFELHVFEISIDSTLFMVDSINCIFFVQGENFSAKRFLQGKLKAKKTMEIDQMGLINKKVKILGDGINVSFDSLTMTYALS